MSTYNPDGPESPKPTPLRCKARSKQTGEQCKRTASPGYSVCLYHGARGAAASAITNVKHGRYAKALKESPELQALVQEYSADPELLKLDQDIAMSRALIHRYTELYGETLVSEKSITGYLTLLDTLGKQIKRRTDIAHSEQYVATNAKVAAWLAQAAGIFAGVLERYLTDQDVLREAKAEVARGIAQIGDVG